MPNFINIFISFVKAEDKQKGLLHKVTFRAHSHTTFTKPC